MIYGSLKWSQPHLWLNSEGEGDGGGGGGTDDLGWRANLPEDIRSEERLGKFKDESEMIQMPVNLARSFIHADRMVGRDKIAMPKTDEEWEETYNKLGRPESAELYMLPTPDGLHDDLKGTAGKDAEWFRETAHKIGLTDKQASELFKEYLLRSSDVYSQGLTDNENQRVDTEIQLRTEYGTTYDGKQVLGDRALRSVGGESIMQLAKEIGLNNHPAFVRFKFKLGELMAEDLGLDKSTGELLVSKESVADQISGLQQSKAYLDPNHPEHRATVNKVQGLYQKLYGNTPIPTSVATMKV